MVNRSLVEIDRLCDVAMNDCAWVVNLLIWIGIGWLSLAIEKLAGGENLVKFELCE